MRLIFGNKKRIFINLRIGCDCQCTYCYLPQINSIEESTNKLDYNEAYNIIRNMKELKLGKKGSILSFGCYSECWFDDLKYDILELIKKLIVLENPIQISTKQRISPEHLMIMNKVCKYTGHITINISMPTISHSRKIEPGTAPITDRLKMLNNSQELNSIQFALYIRPTLDGITIQDKEYYCQIMKKYNIPCIIGGRYYCTKKSNGGLEDVGEGYLVEKEPNDLFYLTEYLSSYGKIYKHSTDLIKDMII